MLIAGGIPGDAGVVIEYQVSPDREAGGSHPVGP
jgi:hypothetical protein